MPGVDDMFRRLWQSARDLQVDYIAGELIDAAFAPKVVAKQVVFILCLQTAVIVSRVAYAGVKFCLGRWNRRRRDLEEKLHRATTYEEWQGLAAELDKIEGMDVWKATDASPLYDSKVLKRRIKELQVMMRNKDLFHLIFRLRSGLTRDRYGIQNAALFSAARSGTKHLIETYNKTVCEALLFVCTSEDESVPADVRLAFFNETRHSYGRSALLLSGGAALGFYHIGLAKCLHLEGVLPRVISGASAGSLMAAMIGTRGEDELYEMITTGKGFRRDFFRLSMQNRSASREDHWVTSQLQYLFPQGFRWISDAFLSLLVDRRNLLAMDTEHLKNVVIENIGTSTFQEAFDRTGRIINIVVAPLNLYDPPRLLNYLTAPHVCIWSAVVASCAIPGVFESIQLVVKEPDGNYRPETDAEYFDAEGDGKSSATDRKDERYSDGSIEKDLPMQQLSELFNVNHFIVSQVNPHSYLLSSMATNLDQWTPAFIGATVGVLKFLKAQCRDWLRNVIDLIVFRSVAPEWAARRGFSQLLTQEYEGRSSDVNIMPWSNDLSIFQAFLSLIRNPTEAEYHRMVLASEKNTWPHVQKLRAHCRIEMTLDQCVQKLRRKVAILNEHHVQRDRTPSFATTRSLVNLSGLGVIDPHPSLGNFAPNGAEGAAASAEGSDMETPQKVGIKKSTSMALFYYGRGSGSNESLSGTCGDQPTSRAPSR